MYINFSALYSYLEHVISGAPMLLPNRISSLLRKVEGFTSQSPGSYDPLAPLEVLGHVGSVALVTGVDVMVELGVGVALVVVAFVHHHVVDVTLRAGGENRPETREGYFFFKF